jgi:hypothetical protein
MSRDFKLRFDEMKQNDPTQNGGEFSEGKQFYDDSNVRNLCFVWPDNRKVFFNYAYLVSSDYLPEDGSITLAFTTHSITLKGAMLDSLYEALLSHLPRKIICVDARYAQTVESDKPIVLEIIVNLNK